MGSAILRVCELRVCELRVCESASCESASCESASCELRVASCESASLRVASLRVASLRVASLRVYGGDLLPRKRSVLKFTQHLTFEKLTKEVFTFKQNIGAKRRRHFPAKI